MLGSTRSIVLEGASSDVAAISLAPSKSTLDFVLKTTYHYPFNILPIMLITFVIVLEIINIES